MHDIEREVYTTLAKAFREQYPNGSVYDEYVRAPSKFPSVSIVETDNYMKTAALDTSESERISTIIYEINVYSAKSTGRKQECRDVINLLDGLMYGMNFTRTAMAPTPNTEDASIYRITARYRADTDGSYTYRTS